MLLYESSLAMCRSCHFKQSSKEKVRLLTIAVQEGEGRDRGQTNCQVPRLQPEHLQVGPGLHQVRPRMHQRGPPRRAQEVDGPGQDHRVLQLRQEIRRERRPHGMVRLPPSSSTHARATLLPPINSHSQGECTLVPGQERRPQPDITAQAVHAPCPGFH